MRKKDTYIARRLWTPGLAFLLVLCANVASGQTPLSLQCARKDTIEVHPLNSAEDVKSLIKIMYAGKEFGFDRPIAQLEKAFALADSLGLRKERALLANSMLYLYAYKEQDLTKQVSVATILANDLDWIDDDKRSAALNKLGNVAISAGDNISALSFYNRAYEAADSLKPLQRLYPLGNLATTYLANTDTATAIKIFHRSRIIVNSIEIPEEIAYNRVYDFASLGGIHLNQGNIDSAQHYLQRAKSNSDFFKPDHARFGEMQIILLPNLIRFYIKTGNKELANKYIDALHETWPGLTLLLKAEYFESIGQLSKALALTDTSIESDLSLDKKRIELRRKLASELGIYKVADEASANLLKIAEETLAKSKKELVTISKARLETSKKEREADIVRYESKLELLETRQRTWIAGCLILLSLGIAIWFNQRYRKSHKHSMNLSKIVSQHQKELILTNEELASRVKSMERFNHLLSHDLREPLRSISGFTSILRRKAKVHTDLSEDFEMLSKSVDQLAYLMTGVEELRRIEERKTEPVRLDLKHLINKVSRNVRAKYGDHNIELEVKGNLSPVVLDENFLNNSLLELVDNGVKFCENKTAHITVEVIQSAEDLKIYVQDEGIGMNIKFREQIFGVFKRLNRRENFVGSGVGLTLVKLATEKCRGSVELLESQLGIGSTFMLSFPKLEKVPKKRNPRKASTQA